MKSNNIKIIKLFLIHIFVYYTFFGFISEIIWNVARDTIFFRKEIITKIIVSSLLGITGMYDGYIFLLIPHILLFVIINRFFKKNILKSFFISSLFIYSFIYLNFEFDISNISLFSISSFEHATNCNIIYVMIPSLAISFFLNYIFMNKSKN
ncbi:hypothetical protein CMU51_11350 [Elizabethkingia anophelis]|uniref:Uncharacterized protein n=1 Tax=Elizabethkingia anophelis TaxID=1117645 RepID=A0AAE4NZ85_9FLAO|nr:hypothetical protein [Elizabethkingia anophelis]